MILDKKSVIKEIWREKIMPDTRSCTYEDLYYEMWEISQRYSQIAQFRVIGKSHDE